MSATLHFDVGAGLVRIMFKTIAFGPATVTRLGLRRGKRGWKFDLFLPGDAEKAWNAYAFADFVACRDYDGNAVRSARSLRKKLRRALGVPDPPHATTDADVGFLRAIAERPGDPVNWMAYADWLQEHAEPGHRDRGRVMAAWLKPEPIHGPPATGKG